MWSFDTPRDACPQDVQLVVAGRVGDGGPDCALTITHALAARGWDVIQAHDAPAQVRGGHSFQTVRAQRGGGVVHAPRRNIDILVSLAEGAHASHLPDLGARSVVVCFEIGPEEEGYLEARGTAVLRLAAPTGDAARNAELAARIVLGLIDPAECGQAVPPLVVTGNEAIAFGALVAGCRFAGVYPMTPATTIGEWLADLDPALGVTVVDAEDEIAAIAMSLGAAYAGARALTATSGGGLALMAESVGFAAMAEIPLVIIDAQRPGPSTGMPTRTEQGDLLFAIHVAQGDVPHIVLAPGDLAECFEVTTRAFDLAECYQCPVIVLTDGHLATTRRTLPASALDPALVRPERGAVGAEDGMDDEEASGSPSTPRYERYAFTLDGISPRTCPGAPRGVHTASSYEHNARGHIEESPAIRTAAVDRRADRLEVARAQARGPRRYGPPTADVTLLTWGSTSMACRQAVDNAAGQGLSVNMLQFTDLWPFPREATAAAMRSVSTPVLVEQNATGQLGALLRCEAGIDVPTVHLRYDGRPITPEEILERAVRRALAAQWEGGAS